MLFKKKKKNSSSRYRIRVDNWLYVTDNSNLTWKFKDASEYHNLNDVIDAAKEIPHSNVVIIENKNSRVKFMSLEEVL